MTPELRSGLLAGVLLATAVGVVLVLTTSGTQRQFGAQPRPVQRNGHRDETFRTPVPIGGLAVVVGTLVTLVGRQPVPGGLLVAIAGVGIISRVRPSPSRRTGVGRARLAVRVADGRRPGPRLRRHARVRGAR